MRTESMSRPGGLPLTFEHLVQINDLANPAITDLSRKQLWLGLVMRATEPTQFLPWLDAVTIEGDQIQGMHRHLDFGSYQVHDTVSFVEEQAIRFDIVDAENGAAFSLIMQIEEPEPEALFVRFLYSAHSVDHHADSPLGYAMREAYKFNDEDMILRIRLFAENGTLDPIHH